MVYTLILIIFVLFVLQNGEFQFDNVQQIAQKGFSIDPQKVGID